MHEQESNVPRRLVTVSLPAPLLARLDALARREERTRQAQLRRLLAEALAAAEGGERGTSEQAGEVHDA
jgi:metal-responsive CopG/Arc/MetJ family transcriptional regulator